MLTFWESREVKKSRKEHWCEWCSKKIKKGSHCFNEAGSVDGKFYHYYLCARCRDVLNEWLDDNYLPGFRIGKGKDKEMLKCPNCHKRVDGGCSNPNCVCHEGEEDGSQLINYKMLYGKIKLSEKFGNFLWDVFCKIDFIIKPWKRQRILLEVRECPYCGHIRHYSAWDDLYDDVQSPPTERM